MDQPITDPISGPSFYFTFTFGPELDKNQSLSGTTTVKTTTINPDNIFLHADLLFDYYKVKIAHGTRMVAGTVRIFCELAGMKAVCTAGPGCSLNTAHCVNTPSSEASSCIYPM